MSKHLVLVVGAGRMGQRIAALMGQDGRYSALITSPDSDALAQAARSGLATAAPRNARFRDELGHLLTQTRAVILTDESISSVDLARLAYEHGTHYLDILESSDSAKAVAALLASLPAQPKLGFAPGCGLAPGHVTGLAAEALDSLGAQAEVTVFVGVLPAEPQNRLGYANIWSIDGLIGEYTTPCLAIQAGALVALPPLSQSEEISLAGMSLEAFTTAGSLDALAQRYAGRVGSLVFKTLRYPGHLNYIEFLLQDMGLSKRLYKLRSLLKTALPQTENDIVLIALRLRDTPQAAPHWICQFLQATSVNGQDLSAIGAATASHVCAMTDLLCSHSPQLGGLIPAGAIGPRLLRASPFFDLLDPAKPSQGTA